MEDFPNYIYAFDATKLEAGPTRIISDDIPSYDGKYIEYIRIDNIPQWKPINTLGDHKEIINVLTKDGYVRIGKLVTDDEILLLCIGKKVKLSKIIYWMNIPKVPYNKIKNKQ